MSTEAKSIEEMSDAEFKKLINARAFFIRDDRDERLHAKLDRIIELLEKGPTVSVSDTREGWGPNKSVLL